MVYHRGGSLVLGVASVARGELSLPPARFHDVPIMDDGEPDPVPWRHHLGLAGEGDRVEARGEAGEDAGGDVHVAVAAPGAIRVVVLGEDVVVGDGGVRGGPLPLVGTHHLIGKITQSVQLILEDADLGGQLSMLLLQLN